MTDYGLSAKARDAIKQIVANEIKSQRPPPRIAEVKSVNVADKTLGVTFTGESNVVSVPYVSELPARIGQFVRIGGGTHDRHVEAVLGETLTQYRVETAESHIDTLMKSVVGENWNEADPDTLPTDVLSYFQGIGDGIDAAQTAANTAQGDVNIARANLAGVKSVDPTLNVPHDAIYDNASFIGYSKCYYIANTLADWDAGNGTYEMKQLTITAYNGVSVNQLGSDGRYSITILEDGYYEFNVSSQWSVSDGNSRRTFVRLDNGTTLLEGSDSPNGGLASAPICGASVYLTAGQVIRFWVLANNSNARVSALGTYISMKQISSSAPALAVGTLSEDDDLSFETKIIGPLRNNSGGFWPNHKVSSPTALTLGTVLAKCKYSGGSGHIWLVRNGVRIKEIYRVIPFSGTFSFFYSGAVSTSDQFWIEADATGVYSANDTFIKITGK